VALSALSRGLFPVEHRANKGICDPIEPRVNKEKLPPLEAERKEIMDKKKIAQEIRSKLSEYQAELERKQVPAWKFPELLKKKEAELWQEVEEGKIRLDAAGDDAESARKRMIQRQQGATARFRERMDAKEAAADPRERMDGVKLKALAEADRVAAHNAAVKEAERQRVHDRDEYDRHSGLIGKETKSLNRDKLPE